MGGAMALSGALLIRFAAAASTRQGMRQEFEPSQRHRVVLERAPESSAGASAFDF